MPVGELVADIATLVEEQAAEESEESEAVVADADNSSFESFVEDLAVLIAEAKEEAAEEVSNEHFEDSAEE